MAARNDEHAFLRFANEQYTTKFEALTRRNIDTPYSLIWRVASVTGLEERINPYFTQIYQTAGGVFIFTCRAWGRLFRISEPIYSELVLEFFSTVSFDATDVDFTRPTLRFRLGQVERYISVIELARRLEIYTQEEIENPRFLTFLDSTLRSPPGDFSDAQFWRDIAGGQYDPWSAKESSIRSPIYRLLHRLITSSISHRSGSEKVPSIDMFYLWCLVTPGKCLNLPFCLANFLSSLAIGTRGSICGGHFVTRLARSFNILTPEVIRSLTCYEPTHLGLEQLEILRIVSRGTDRTFMIPEDDPDKSIDQVEQIIPRRWRRVDPPVTQQPPTPASTRSRRKFSIHPSAPHEEKSSFKSKILAEIASLREQSDKTSEQMMWIGEQMIAFFDRHGFEVTRPFPSSLSRHSRDEAGPSGMRHNDKDN